jgi:hypothetical protein
MRGRALALILALALVTAATWHLRAPQSAMAQFRDQLPGVLGSFRVTERKDNEQKGYLWATYNDPQGYVVDYMIQYGKTSRHDAVGCWQTLGQPPVWQKLVPLKTATTSIAVFDVAIFRDKNTMLRLIAASSCRSGNCSQSLFPGAGWRWPTLESLRASARRVVSVAISIQMPGAVGHEALVGRLDDFVGTLDLAAVEQAAATDR